ncbi:MAG: hypothetical protein K2X50_02875 [Gammaproteobacteria bacterium]|nr:hypothetical protein [Gammaproteobacteria bacterium]
MSKRKKGNIHTDKQAVKPDSSQPQRTNDNDTQHPDHSNKGNHVKGDEAKLTYRNISKLSNSKNFQHNPDNVKDYFKTGNKIEQTFDAAKNVPDSKKNPITGKLGELATEQNLYAQRGNARVKIYDSKVGGKKENGIDIVAQKDKHIPTIESKATRTEATFKLAQTKTQGEQMSPQWMREKIREMWSSPKTAPTAALLSSQPYTKYISMTDVDYGAQTVRFVTDPNRVKPLPHDVGIWESAKAATHGEMFAMRTLNTVGKGASYIAITLDAAQVVGQIHHDIKKKDWSFSRSFRLVIEKGAGVVGSITAVVALNAGTDFVGCAGSFVVGAAGYDIGQDVGSDFADTLGLSPLDDDEREKATRDGMKLLGGEAGVAFLNGVETVAGTISGGLSSGCEVLNDTLPFEVCSPGAQATSLPQSPAPEEINSGTDNTEPNACSPSISDNVKLASDSVSRPDISLQSTTANSSAKEVVNASYPSDSGRLTSEPEKAAPEKPLGFHARRLEIMKSHAENRSAAENSQATYPKCEALASSKNQSVLTDSEHESTYQSPRPSPF